MWRVVFQHNFLDDIENLPEKLFLTQKKLLNQEGSEK